MGSNTVLETLAAVARTLSSSELRTLLELLHLTGEANECAASSRQIAERSGQSRTAVKAALDSLESHGYISVDNRSASAPANITVHFLGLKLLVPGSKSDPPPQQNLWKSAPQVGQNLTHPGSEFDPPLDQNLTHPGSEFDPPHKESSRARAHAFEDSISIEADKDFHRSIARTLASDPSKTDATLMRLGKDWIWGYMRKFGDPTAHPPDDFIVAQFVAVCEWPRLEGLLYDLMAERRKPGQSYAWFVTVALQRMWGLTPTAIKKARATLRLVHGKERATQNAERALAASAAASTGFELESSIAAVAARKAMR